MVTISAVALIFEGLTGYPAALFRLIGHPVTWMGKMVEFCDRLLNRETYNTQARQALGAASILALVVMSCLVGGTIQHFCLTALSAPIGATILALLASTCMAQRSLDTHVRAVAQALDNADVAKARCAVAKIVGRDTTALNQAGVAKAAIESLAENFADGVVAPAFWVALLGLPGGFAYKAINTADSMIGHRTLRHEAFGFATAKLDDLVNWVPARLASLLLVTAAAFFQATSAQAAWRIIWRDASGHPSPNAGWPEAAMAGALGITLGGPRTYHGQPREDHSIGDGPRPADAMAVYAALGVFRAACALQIVVLGGTATLIALWR